MSTWEETTDERIRRPFSTTAAAVSSQDVSMPRIRMIYSQKIGRPKKKMAGRCPAMQFAGLP
jgi:hypothetical protein